MVKEQFYLAHSCELIDSVRKWELKVQGKYYIELINPFKGNQFENMEELRKLTTRKKLLEYMKTLNEEVCEKIVTYDLELLRKCDGVVALFNNPSVGTAMEIFAGAYMYRMPVYVICRSYINHPWIAHLCWVSGGKAFTSRVAFEEFLKERGLRRY